MWLNFNAGLKLKHEQKIKFCNNFFSLLRILFMRIFFLSLHAISLDNETNLYENSHYRAEI